MKEFNENLIELHSNDLAEAFEAILSGETINRRIGKWNISNLNSKLIVDLIYEDFSAAYTFALGISQEAIVFQNVHREAKKGLGSETLEPIESALAELASKLKKKIIITFLIPESGQDGTRVWLAKNGYSSSTDSLEMAKEISV